jgi:hypothetical protein
MSLFPLKPTHKPVLAYYAALAQFHQHGHTTEGNTRPAFADLLDGCPMIPEGRSPQGIVGSGTSSRRPDAGCPHLALRLNRTKEHSQNPNRRLHTSHCPPKTNSCYLGR